MSSLDENASNREEWHYACNNVQKGPVSWNDLCVKVSPESLVWRAGMKDWIAFSKVLSTAKPPTDETPLETGDHHKEKESDAPQQNDKEDTSENAENKKKRVRKKRKPKPPPNSSVYISKLPEDVTVDELVEHFKPCGIIKQDFDTGEFKVRIYEDDEGNRKGDGVIHFLQPLSADTAVELKHNSQLRPGIFINVEKAKFDNSKPAPKKAKLPPAQLAVQRRLHRKKMQELFQWDEDPDPSSGLRIVILKRMFAPEEAVGDVSFYDDLEREIGLECQKIAGPIEKLTVFKGSPFGAVAVKFRECADAEKCIEVLNGRYFGGRRVEAEWFDGVTNYKVKESQEEEKKRIEQFGDWLEK